MQFKKFASACVLGAVLTTAAISPAEADATSSLNIVINNVQYNNVGAGSPENINGRVYVPLRLVSEALGYDIEWDGTTRSILIDSDASAVLTANGTIQIYIDNQLVKTDSNTGMPYLTPEGRTMVPVRIVTEKLGATVNWDSTQQTVEITTGNNGSAGNNNSNNSGSTNNNSGTTTVPDSNATVKPDTSSKPQSASEVTLRGASYCTLAQMQRYLDNLEVTVQRNAAASGKTFVPFPDNIAKYYYEIGLKYNIRGDVALAQALLETGYFQYGNEVKPEQNNYCGLGAIGRVTTAEDLQAQLFSAVNSEKAYLKVGTHGWWYATPAIGVEAHIQHLYSYASADALPSGCELLDGRFAHGNRGKATYLTDLNGKWAVPGTNYGQNIYNNMLVPMMNS